MSDVSSLIQVFRMTEISIESRINVIRRLGRLINDSFGANITEPLVYELIKLLDPNHPEVKILQDCLKRMKL
jgi:hypothetical protein